MGRKPILASESAASSTIDVFEAMGGSAKCRELAAAFYSRVSDHPTLRPMFPGKSRRCAIDALAAFLVQFLGGPSEDAQRWWLSLRESHSRFQIGLAEQEAWLQIMSETLRNVEMNQSMRSALTELFEDASAYVVNTGPAVAAAKKRQSKPSDVQVQIRRRWEQQRALDEAVAAVREGELTRLAALVEGPLLQSCFQRSRSVYAQFVGVLIGSGHDVMAQYARRILAENPDLAGERFSGRTLLHVASAAGDLPMVAALLDLGIDANLQDDGGHTPLYCVGNECPAGGPVARALIQGGARVDACDGVKRCTPLHMAARRGYVEVAEALIECGAHLEARDSLGETPLRRAINCGKPAVAAFLLAKGADPSSIGSQGLTPRSAARSGKMRRLFQT